MYLKRSPYKVILGGIRAKHSASFTESSHLQVLFILQRLAFMTRHQFFPACPPFVNTVYTVPKTPENLLVCPFCHLNEVEHKLHFLFNCNHYDSLRSNFYRNISNGYPLFNNFDNNGKTLFISDNVDLHIYRLTAAYIHSCMEYRQKIVL